MCAKRTLLLGFLPTLVMAVLVMGWGVQKAGAQSGEEVLKELRWTDSVLLKAKRLVIDQGCPSKRARELLAQATDLQQDAWGAHWRGQHKMAMKGTRAARELAQEAIKIAERWQFVVKQIRRTRELLDLAAEMVAASQNPRAAALQETALRQFERGNEALRGGQIEQAFYLLKNANKLARDIISMLQEEEVESERVSRELNRTDRLIDRAGPLIEESGDEKAQVLFDRGVQTQLRAREFFEEGRNKVAYQLTLKARELVVRALVMVEGPISPERIRQAIVATDELMEQIRPIIVESQNQGAMDLLLTAGNHQDKAKMLLEAKRYKLALAQTKIARRLADKALEMAGGA
jgi:hypothetical protein